MAKTKNDPTLPDWWQREKQRRQNWILLFLVTLGILIAYFYAISFRGRIGTVKGIDFDSRSFIAFIHQEKNGNTTFYAVRSDGSDLRRLTPPDDKSNKQDPTWTADGKSLLYSSNRSDSKVMQVYVLGQGEPRQLTYGTGNKFQPMASSDGKHILFLTQGVVKTVLLNGNDVDQVLPVPSAGSSVGNDQGSTSDLPTSVEPKGPFLRASFAPDGVSIVAVQAMTAEDAPTQGDITSNDQVVRVLHPNVKGNSPLDFGREAFISWEPNGTRLATAFTEREMKDPANPASKSVVSNGIHLWDFSGKDSKPKGSTLIATAGGLIQMHDIAWSPDGKFIAFEVWETPDENTRTLRGVAVSSAVQGGLISTKEDVKAILKQLMLKADAKGIPSNPKWSPDGARLLYELRRPDGGHDLCVINSDGTNPQNLTEKLGGDNTQSSWAPMKP